jgi:acetyltransferase-like isoleucine patch superfamily enzyme
MASATPTTLKDRILARVIATLFPRFNEACQHVRVRTRLGAVLLQKILRVNSHVPWPVHFTTRVYAPGKIKRGTRSPGLAPGCHLDGRNGIIFGENVWVGPYVSVISQSHDTSDYEVYTEKPPIEIGDNSWLGAHAIVLPGVKLGPHTVVAAGAVVTKSFPEGDQILGGNPARVIKKLPPYKGTA